MLPLLLPLVAQLAPSLVDWLFGAKAAATTAAVAQAVQVVTGADPSTADGAAAAQAIIQGKPDLALQLRTELMTVKAQMQAAADREADAQRQADLAALQATLADVAGARAQTVALAGSHSTIAWGAPVLSAVILVAFAAMLCVVLTRAIPEGSAAIANVLLGTLGAMATQVANYWLGSSAGSAAKTDLLANSVPARLLPRPAG